ncbi:TIGR02281 family clan AA aspartic protease [Pseudahrensia aquimaris]|uniref:TIGR02281 family clan AA aspartic protease n=1 Tax=Pseudahrensia aquimaris TaxID=744461 RepID=A0ABW3FF21_9HYPH
MDFHHNLLVGGAGLVVLALAAPSIFGVSEKSAKSEPANITRAADDPNAPKRMFSKPEPQVRKAPRRLTKGCDPNGDLGPANCRSTRKASSSKSGSFKRSKGGRSVTVEADAVGQFKLNARMNGRRVPVLVDTGATSVAINLTTARRLGINVTQEDFKHEATTANGKTLFASAQIREIRIGGIVVSDVPAAVLSDKALGSTLLGAAFLKRLSKYTVENGQLKMTQ